MSRTRIVLLITVLALALAGLGLVGCSEEAAFEVGDTVAAEWSDGYLYLSEVTEVDGDDITVTYLDDDTTGDLDATQVFAIEETEWEVGDPVLAVWAVARFYSGTIDVVEGDGDYTVAWDDGSMPSLVAEDHIIAFHEKYADEASEVFDTDTSSDDEDMDDGESATDLAGVWTNTGADVFAELELNADGGGTVTDIDGTNVEATWTLVDGYLEIILVDTDGTEITTGATTTMVSDNEFIWDAEIGSFVK